MLDSAECADAAVLHFHVKTAVDRVLSAWRDGKHGAEIGNLRIEWPELVDALNVLSMLDRQP